MYANIKNRVVLTGVSKTLIKVSKKKIKLKMIFFITFEALITQFSIQKLLYLLP